MAYNPYLAIPIGVALLVGVLVSALSGAWWAVMIGTFGLASGAVLMGCIMRDEWRHSPLYYLQPRRCRVVP